MDNNIDKWGSLSMPERASLISLFTGSGVTSLDEMRALYNEYGNGGGIHIDPSKKGTFTSAAKRHGMSVQEFASCVLSNKDDYSTAMVRKANFARNAAKWHEEGGDLDDNDPKKTHTMDDIKAFRQSGALKEFNLERYSDGTIDALLDLVASNNTVNNLPKNANYAAYGDDFSNSL